MRIINRQTAILRRPLTSGYYQDDGNYVDSISYIIKPVKCSIQPATNSALKQFNEEAGIRTSDFRVMYTRSELSVTDEDSKFNSDTIIYKCVEYEVVQIDPWEGVKRLTHNKVLLKKRDKAKRLFT